MIQRRAVSQLCSQVVRSRSCSSSIYASPSLSRRTEGSRSVSPYSLRHLKRKRVLICYSQQALRNLCALPPLRHGEVGDDTCPICLCPLESIIQEHDKAGESYEVSSGLPGDHLGTIEMTGAVKLSICGHIFCRKECVLLSIISTLKLRGLPKLGRVD